MRRIFTPEQDQVVAAEYDSGVSSNELAKKYNTDFGAVLGAVRRAGGTVRSRHESNLISPRGYGKWQRIFTDEEERAMAAEYLATPTATLRQIGEKRGVNINLVMNGLRRQGVVRRVHTRTHTVNESAFDDILKKPEMCYLAGLWMADGNTCIRLKRGKVSYSISIALCGEDGNFLARVREILGSSHSLSRHRVSPTAFHTDNQVTKLSIDSERLTNALRSFGVVAKRAHTARFLRGLDQSRDVWRGMVDGDGYVSLRGMPAHPYIGLCGSYQITRQFIDFLEGKGIAIGRRPSRNRTIWGISLSGKSAADATRLLYADCSVALPRKLAIAQSIMNWSPRTQRRCEYEGCGRKHYGLGLCHLHYCRHKKEQ